MYTQHSINFASDQVSGPKSICWNIAGAETCRSKGKAGGPLHLAKSLGSMRWTLSPKATGYDLCIFELGKKITFCMQHVLLQKNIHDEARLGSFKPAIARVSSFSICPSLLCCCLYHAGVPRFLSQKAPVQSPDATTVAPSPVPLPYQW